MQAQSLDLKRQTLGGLPLIDEIFKRFKLPMLLEAALHHPAYVDAILLLVKNILTRPRALYAVKEWSSQFDPKLVYGGKIGDDKLARALDRLYEIDRASLMTLIVMRATQSLQIDTSQIHHDTTSIKFSGAYENQDEKAVQLKRGHSKDHRPDLKQLIYGLCVTADGSLPIHFKTYDGNKTDDSIHVETWQTLRGILDRSDFLYVADSKLCTHENLSFIDRNQGKFITVLPRTRRETKTFAEQLSLSLIRWDNIYSKRSSRKSKRIDLYESAQGLFQMQEGYRIYWYRSSEKVRRDEQSREERLGLAKSRLKRLGDIKRRPAHLQRSRRTNSEVYWRKGSYPQPYNYSHKFQCDGRARTKRNYFR
jgi:transposase